MMGNQPEQQAEQDNEHSFYSDDSFDNVYYDPTLKEVTCFKNKHKVQIPELVLTGLPEYETTEEDEEEEGEQDEIQHISQPNHGLVHVGMDSPEPREVVHPELFENCPKKSKNPH